MLLVIVTGLAAWCVIPVKPLEVAVEVDKKRMLFDAAPPPVLPTIFSVINIGGVVGIPRLAIPNTVPFAGVVPTLFTSMPPTWLFLIKFPALPLLIPCT